MSALAYITGIRPGAPLVRCGWTERFNEADYAAFYAKYVGQFPRDTGLPPVGSPAAGNIQISSGEMRLLGGVSGGPFSIEFSPPLTDFPAEEFWFRLIFEERGGAWDGPLRPVNPLAYDSRGQNSWAVRVDTAPNYSISASDGTAIYNTDTTFTEFLPVGTYTFLVCTSRPAGVGIRNEFWINPATRGAAADAIATIPAPLVAGTRGFDAFVMRAQSPSSVGRTLVLHSIDAVCGNRASDPFGIL